MMQESTYGDVGATGVVARVARRLAFEHGQAAEGWSVEFADCVFF
ncbi:MAG: hypothetical protein ABSC25_27940 [Roseiarcus sp.]|jgi:hypothetical protein